MIIPVNDKLNKLANLLPAPLYVVGGYVRNYLIDKTISEDIDLSGDFSTEQMIDCLNKCKIEILATYKRTGTVMFKCGTAHCEWTAMRKEVYAQGGSHNPVEITFSHNIEDDAKRRDFKCNAIYYDIKNQKIVDVLGGIKNIEQKVLDTVVDASEVFCSDGLRLMRLARFVGQLNFTPTSKVLESAKKFSKNILDISVERIYAELKSILSADDKYSFSPKDGHYLALKALSETNVLAHILPELESGRNMAQRQDFHNYDVLEHTLKSVLYAKKEVRLAALLHDIGKPYCYIKNGKFFGHDKEGCFIAKKILSRLKVDKETTKNVLFLVENHMKDLDCKMKENKIRHFIIENLKYIESLYLLKQADFMACKDSTDICPTIIKWKKIEQKMKEEQVPKTIKELKISALDLLERGIVKQNISKELKKLHYLCVENPKLNTKEKLLTLIGK